MRCRKKQLGLYLDDKLNSSEKALLEEHLSNCPECNKQLLEMRHMFRLIRPEPAPEPGALFLQEVMGAISKEALPMDFELQRRRRVGRIVAGTGITLSTGVFAVLGISFGPEFVSSALTAFEGLWGKSLFLVPEGIIRAAEGLGNLPDKAYAFETAVNSMASNPYLWAAAVMLGYLGLSAARDILQDVQKLLGYNNRG